MNARESSWLTGALYFCLTLALPIVLIVATTASDEDERPPQRAPLVDLCAWFPYPKVTALVPKPRQPQRQTIFYGEIQCNWTSQDGDTTLELSAARMTGADNAEEEVQQAQKHYLDKLPSSDAKTTTAGMGDQSSLAVRADRDRTGVTITVRDGLLVVQVAYRAPSGSPESLTPKIRDAATELLRLLPRKGL